MKSRKAKLEKLKPPNVWYKHFPWHSDISAGEAQVELRTLTMAPFNWSVPISHDSRPKHTTDLFHGRHFDKLYSRKGPSVINYTNMGWNPLSVQSFDHSIQWKQLCSVLYSSGGATQSFRKVILMISSKHSATDGCGKWPLCDSTPVYVSYSQNITRLKNEIKWKIKFSYNFIWFHLWYYLISLTLLIIEFIFI